MRYLFLMALMHRAMYSRLANCAICARIFSRVVKSTGVRGGGANEVLFRTTGSLGDCVLRWRWGLWLYQSVGEGGNYLYFTAELCELLKFVCGIGCCLFSQADFTRTLGGTAIPS